MNKKKNKKNIKQGLIDLLRSRIKSLEIEKRLYEQNSVLTKNIKIANTEIIEGDLAVLRKILSRII